MARDSHLPKLIVRVLGTPRLDERPDIGRHELTLVALLACRGGTLATSAARDALWNGKAIAAKTMSNLVAKTRQALGDFDDGSPVMPPADRSRGTLRLDARVTTDLSLLRQAIHHAAVASAVEAIRVLRDGLALVEGPPFDASSYDWAHWGQDVFEAVTLIKQASDRLVDLALDAGQLDIARQAVIRGLRAVPGDENLYGARMRTEAAAGNHTGVVAAHRELTAYLADLETQPSSATKATYHELIVQRRLRISGDER